MDDEQFISFLERLDPADFDRVVVRLPGAASHLANKVSPLERATALILYADSSGGPGRDELRRVVGKLFPDNIKPPLPGEAERRVALPSPNPRFVGRKEALKEAKKVLKQKKRVALVGMPGVGKTQMALKLAQEFEDSCPHRWFLSAESDISLRAGYAALAGTVDERYRSVKDLDAAVGFALHWLNTNTGWLLVLDNVDDVANLPDALTPEGEGLLLITGRDAALVRHATVYRVQKMAPEEGANCLLAHAGIRNASDAERADAEALSREMDGLPLALEQAGRFIAEAGGGVAGYRTLYAAQRGELLDRSGARVTGDARTVYRTFTVAVAKASADAPAVEELLRHAAYLAPDDILEAFFTGNDSAGRPMADLYPDPLKTAAADALRWNDTLAAARRLGLIDRDETRHSFSVHRLLQDVLRARPSTIPPDDWQTTERATIERLADVLARFNPGPDFAHWTLLDRLLPHQLTCVADAAQYGLETKDVAALLNQTTFHLKSRAAYAQAERLLRRALKIYEQVLEPNHPDTASSINNLAFLLKSQGKYAEAEPLYRRALKIRENLMGAEHPDTATSINNLAALLRVQGNYAEAEPLYRRALEIFEQALGPGHSHTASSNNNLALFLDSQGNYVEAESLYRRALEIFEQVLGPEHPDTASSLNNLGVMKANQGLYGEAESLIVRALAIWERTLGLQHPRTQQARQSLTILRQWIASSGSGE